MLITNWEIKEIKDTVEVAADIDNFRLYYKVPRSYPVARSGDAFLAAALIPAMLKGEKLEIDPRLPVSPKLLKNAFRLQEIHHCWNPIFKMIPVVATTQPAAPLNAGVLSFFSGGVDSMYTLLKRTKEISHEVFIQGFDFYLDSATYQTAIDRNTSFLQKYGKTLIPVETNFYDFGYRYNLSRNLTQGSCLGSVALLLGFRRVYISSCYSYDQLIPLGSHPLTDPLWANEAIEIIHDGCEAKRTEKLKKISEYASALSNLTVCFNDMNKNCGDCPKCIRTMLPLKLLNISAAPFPPLPPLKAIKKIRIADEIEMIFFLEILILALQSDNADLRDALYACMKRYERIKLFKEIDRVLLGGLIKQAYRSIVKERHVIRRIDTTPPKDGAGFRAYDGMWNGD